MTKNNSPQLIVALDVPTQDEALSLVDQLADDVQIFKVGSQLFTACGPEIVRSILQKGKEIFLDLKFHDIPNTVANAVQSAVSACCVDKRSVFMLTVHLDGGAKMLEAAIQAATQASHKKGVKRPIVVGITVLTSHGREESKVPFKVNPELIEGLTSDEKTDNIPQFVLEKAFRARKAGLDGVVASVNEVPVIRREFGNDWIVVTPGIRPKASNADDQKRTATPDEAVKAGSNFLIVGRPVIEASDPRKAVYDIQEEIREACHSR
jgi:orotidine-5'-phosphate decarboxylase